MITNHQYIKGIRKNKIHKTKSPALKKKCQSKATVLRLDILKPKKPNSAKRKCCKVRLRKEKKF